MSSLRALTRLFAIIVFTAFFYLVYLLGLLFLELIRRGNYRWRHRMLSLWALVVRKIMGMDIHVNGTLPESPFFLVSNHLSYVDIVPFFALLPCTFVAKSELATWPVLGTMAKSLNVIFINRENHRDIPRVNRRISSNIREDQGVILFPEATSSPGKEVLPFRSSLLKYPAEHKFPVSYASITYRTTDKRYPAETSICWWGEMTFADHFFNLLKLKNFETTVSFGDRRVIKDNRKKLADTMHQLVKEMFVPVS